MNITLERHQNRNSPATMLPVAQPWHKVIKLQPEKCTSLRKKTYTNLHWHWLPNWHLSKRSLFPANLTAPPLLASSMDCQSCKGLEQVLQLHNFKRTVFKASKTDNKSLSDRKKEKRVIILLKNERCSFAFLFNKVIFWAIFKSGKKPSKSIHINFS